MKKMLIILLLLLCPSQVFAVASGYSLKRTLTINNSNGGALTNYQIRVVLTSTNFDFTKAESDGSDIVFFEGSTQLDHFTEEYDNGAETGLIWVEVPSITNGASPTITMFYGNSGASDASSGDNTFEYYNALANDTDRDDFGSTHGTATWTSATDVTAPSGGYVQAIATSNDHGRYQSNSLSTLNYITQVTVKDIEGLSSGPWMGPLIDMTGTSTWRRPGFTNQTSTPTVQVRTDASTNDGRTLSTSVGPDTGWFKNITIWQSRMSYTRDSGFSTSTIDNEQGVCWDAVNNTIMVTGNDDIARYDSAGSSEEEVVDSPGGTSWGDCKVVDIGGGNRMYVARYDSTTSANIYWFDPQDLASGSTLEEDISSDISSGGINGLAYDGTNWLVGETNADNVNRSVYVFNSDFTTLKKTILYPHGDGVGIQGMEFKDGLLYVTEHDGGVAIFNWDTTLLEMYMVGGFQSPFSDLQSLALNEDNVTWYFNDRTGSEMEVVTLSKHATEKGLTTFWPHATRSMATIHQGIASPNTQDKLGIGGYRDERFSEFFIRQQTLHDPLVSVGSEETNSTKRVMVIN